MVWRDGRNGIECDVAWGGGGQGDVIRKQPGPRFFSEMFPGVFKPLAQFLKVRRFGQFCYVEQKKVGQFYFPIVY